MERVSPEEAQKKSKRQCNNKTMHSEKRKKKNRIANLANTQLQASHV